MLRRAMSPASGHYYAGHRQWGPCTECLGTESGEVGGQEDEVVQRHLSAAAAGAEEEEDQDEGAEEQKQQEEAKEKRRRRTAAKARPLFPPVMRSVAEASLRAERRGGRLILTEVPRPPGMPRGFSRECGADGRLRIRFFYAVAPAVAEEEEEGEDEAADEVQKKQQNQEEEEKGAKKEDQEAAAPPDQSSNSGGAAAAGGGCGANAAGAEKRVQMGAVVGM